MPALIFVPRAGGGGGEAPCAISLAYGTFCSLSRLYRGSEPVRLVRGVNHLHFSRRYSVLLV